MTYSYQTASNKLSQVNDAQNDPQSKLGDFKYSGSKGPNDYAYDGNGNMVLDSNKAISGITYNHLNLPNVISVASKGNITYTYDAAGNKVSKVTVDNTVSPTVTATTLYLDGFVYLNDTLQFINHEEGRIRWANHKYLNGSTAYGFEYDYFIKDHLGNVRMVLTQQKDTTQYIATMEAAYRNTENKLFYNIPASNYSRAAVTGYPSDPTTNPNDSLMRLNGSGQKVGAAIILKVMSGDIIDIAVKAFYKDQTYNTPNNSVNDILNALAIGAYSLTGGTKGSLAELNNTGTSPLFAAINSFISNNNPTIPSKPRAHLNWILLDEQFQYVNSYPQSGALAVGNYASNTLNTLAYTGINITKNGFLYIYVNNETPGWDVFFDNMSVKHYSGALLEETHFYPFGLTMANISTKAVGKLENRYEYNGKEKQELEFKDGTGLDWYDYGARMYDNQIGRFFVQDRFLEKYSDISPYQYGLNNPILNIEINGDSILTFFYDKDGKQINTIPEEVKKAFAEMGISIGYNAETNMLYGSAIEGSTQTSAQKSMLVELGSCISQHSMLFGYELGYVSGKQNGVLFGKNITNEHKSLTLIDLDDFNSDGSAKGEFTNGLTTKTFNLTRVIEHEYLGHGVHGYEDQPNGTNDPGPLETLFGNPARSALNIPERLQYVGQEAMTGKIYVPFGSNGKEYGRHVLTPELYKQMSTAKNVVTIITKHFSKL